MFPIETSTLHLLVVVAFGLISCLCFVAAFEKVRPKLLFGLPVFMAALIVVYVCATTDWSREYAGLRPMFVVTFLGGALVVAFLWVGVAYRGVRRLAPKNLVFAAIVAVLPCAVIAGYSIWDQTVPRNDCATSHLEVHVGDTARYRVFPEFRFRFDHRETSISIFRFQARYSSLTEDKRELARLCRRDSAFETTRLWFTPEKQADAIEAACQKGDRPFCSHVDPDVMRQLVSVKIGAHSIPDIAHIQGRFSRARAPDDVVYGTVEEGAVCSGIGSRFQSCRVWRRLDGDQVAIAQTGQGASGLSPMDMRDVATKGLDQVLAAFAAPSR